MEQVRQRLLYIDNLRLFVIVCVVMHHLAVTYSGFGSWYYNETTHPDTLATVWFAFYLSFQQAYFMGLLFMIAGYFVAGSYDHKGFGQFIGDRCKRLLIPTLIYMLVITPLIEYVELRQKYTGFSMAGFLSSTGVMWFAVALFIFSSIYAVARRLVRRRFAR
jgi:glucans biosynthesis protein C